MEQGDILIIAKTDDGMLKYKVSSGTSLHEAIGALEVVKQSLLSEINNPTITNEEKSKQDE